MKRFTIEQLKYLKESEDKIEFKRAEQGNLAYDGGTRTKPNERRRCILGYVTALCNEGGGSLVIGMSDNYPHKVVGTKQSEDAIGELESNIYRDTQIRPQIYELYEDEVLKRGRVLVITVPSRPIGQVFKFEDVPLMRVGEELKPMSNEVFFNILQEQEPDFSATIVEGVSIADLDEEAVKILRQKYVAKHKNTDFLTLETTQVLSDLQLIKGSKVTFAALILLGKKEKIKEFLPQASVILEYRKAENLIAYDNRQVYCEPFYKMIELLWHDINLRNDKIDINENSYIFNIPFFNEEVIREAINNAIAHRDYKRTSEIVIKQYPQKMIIMNAGGFPLGVEIDNLLRVQSTPRNRLLADVLAKTGIVERSGQGIDKIFKNTLSEGKDAPDYTHSDSFRVELHLSAIIKDKSFAIFLDSEQRDLAEEDRLSVFDVIALDKIRQGFSQEVEKDIIDKLLRCRLIEKRGKTRGIYYILAKSYYEISGKEAEYSQKNDWDIEQIMLFIMPHLKKFEKAKMKDFAKLLEGHLTRRQVRIAVEKLVDLQYLIKEGEGTGTYYRIAEKYIEDSALMIRALDLGMEEMRKRGEIA